MAARHVAAYQEVLLKLQTTFATGEAALVNTDVSECFLDDLKISATPAVSPIVLAGGGTPSKSVLGPAKGELTLSYPLRNGGAATPGQWTLPLQCSGMKQSAASSIYTYVPTYKQSEFKDCSVWHYTGNLDTTSALLRKVNNCMFDAEFTFDWRGEAAVGKVTYTGVGSSPDAPAPATQATITKSTVGTQTIVGATVSMFGDSDYDPLMIKFTIKRNPVALANFTSGYGMTLFSGTPEITWEATVYKDSGALAETALRAGTLGAISVSWGVAPNKLTFATGAGTAQITECSDGNQDNVDTYELKGIIVGNDFTVTCDCTAA
jgi:hypothetical protein